MGLDLEHDLDPASIEPPGPRRHFQMSVGTMMRVLFALACACWLITMLGRAVQSAREAVRLSCCTCNLCQIKLALLNYHDRYNALPPPYVADAAGQPMHSWRVLILPFLEQQTLNGQYDFSEPWNGPNNIKLLNCMPMTFACPSRSGNPTTLTSYVVITGPGTFFPGSASTRFADATDGLSNTLMVVEVANVNIPWTAPWDLDVRTMSFRINDPKRLGISSKHSGGANVVLGDASTRFLRESISPENLRALISIAGGEGISADHAFP
jgi:hypothetical protein